ncbi:KxYKxGKxW signal peptide domain-containing protein [Loigolactobacillus bifermentans]|uniref:Gram-positive cocci surface proteins LPxTG domain-containing protein n=1 Tax=Loigolactobacillus bifermentans DSM 20003 TaxID=1423726 RepID=A0A0R1GY61_9LACO|nr:KxYKxGKxW signal peptide domain-containing protein [Loigolactobacillus bifermentans]KRK39102.1 hypothetical protein FC07_GL002822 [Loigolactobacillus bifermentans DSM 20003]
MRKVRFTASLVEQKQHFKLYKSGKKWLILGVTTASFGVLGLTTQVNAATSDTANQTADAQNTTDANSLQQSTVALTNASAATSTAASSAVSRTATASSAAANQSATTVQPTSAAASASYSSTATPASAASNVTNLGAATATEVATAKSAAASTAAVTGQAQQVTAASAVQPTTDSATAGDTTLPVEQTKVSYIDIDTGQEILPASVGREGDLVLDQEVNANVAQILNGDYGYTVYQNLYQWEIDGDDHTPNVGSILGMTLDDAKQKFIDIYDEKVAAYNSTHEDQLVINVNGTEGTTMADYDTYYGATYYYGQNADHNMDNPNSSVLYFEVQGTQNAATDTLNALLDDYTETSYYAAYKVLSEYHVVPILGISVSGVSGKFYSAFNAMMADDYTMVYFKASDIDNTVMFVDTINGTQVGESQTVTGKYGRTVDLSSATLASELPAGYHYATADELGTGETQPTDATMGVKGTVHTVYVAYDQGVVPDGIAVRTNLSDSVSVTADDYYDYSHPQVKTQTGDALSVTADDYYDYSHPQIKTQTGDALSVTANDYYDYSHPQTKTQVGDAVFVTPDDYYNSPKGVVDEAVIAKKTQVGHAVSVTADDYYDYSHPQVKTQTGDALSVTADDYYDYSHPQSKVQLGEAVSVTPTDYYDHTATDTADNGGTTTDSANIDSNHSSGVASVTDTHNRTTASTNADNTTDTAVTSTDNGATADTDVAADHEQTVNPTKTAADKQGSVQATSVADNGRSAAAVQTVQNHSVVQAANQTTLPVPTKSESVTTTTATTLPKTGAQTEQWLVIAGGLTVLGSIGLLGATKMRKRDDGSYEI